MLFRSAALLLRPTDRLVFKPTTNWHGAISESITFRAWDQSSGTAGSNANITTIGTGGSTPFSTNTDTVSLTVTPVNDQPTASSNVTLPAFTEDVSTPSGITLSSLSASFGYSDATDDQSANSAGTATGGNTATAFSYIAITANASSSTQGKWQVSKTSSPSAPTATDWVDLPTSGLATTTALLFSSEIGRAHV